MVGGQLQKKEELARLLAQTSLLVIEWWTFLERRGSEGEPLNLDDVCFNTVRRTEDATIVPLEAPARLNDTIAGRI